MGLRDQGITYKEYDQALVASVRTVIKKRKNIYDNILHLADKLPPAAINGSPFAIFHFVTSVKNAHDVEIGFPIKKPLRNIDIKSRVLPKIKVLSLKHTGTAETISQSYDKLYRAAYSHGLISDEFNREVYAGWNNNTDTIEIQFIIHDWHALLINSIEKVKDKNTVNKIMQNEPILTIESSLDERFYVTKSLIERIDRLLDDRQKYDIVSRCAHKFPEEQITKLRNVYQENYKKTGNSLAAVDAVIEFMAVDPGWGEKPQRRGNTIYSSKAPRDPEAFEKASTIEEKRKAYCFCPIIREHMDKGMPVTFCYCGAGWYRQQWEGAIGKPVRIEVVESVLKGDECCQFAIHLPEE